MAEASNTPRLTVAVVGGAGGMGRYAVRALVRLGCAEKVFIADLDTARAAQLAREVGAVAEAVRLDATDKEQMADLFSQCDVVLNTMGPFAKFGTPILRAALQADCDYLDVDDDWQSTIEAYELDELARSKGRCAVIGMGASPGLTNLFARAAAERLDEVEELLTGWSLTSAVVEEEADYPPTGNPAAAAEHWLIQNTGTIEAWVDGRQASIKPLQRVDFEFPGVGPTYGYTMGHPEPLTLPRTYPGLRRSLNLQVAPDELIAELVQVVADYEAGVTTVTEAGLANRAPRKKYVDVVQPLPGAWALGIGRRGGERKSVAVYSTLTIPGKMGGATGTPLAVGAELLRRGKIKNPGVHAPEAAIDPQDFFDVLGSILDVQDGQQSLVIREA